MQIEEAVDQSNPSTRKLTWPVISVGLLLLGQAAGLAVLGFLHYKRTDILGLLGPVLAPTGEETFLGVEVAFLLSLVFFVLSLLALVSAIGILRFWPFAWIAAVLVQGLALLIALALYFQPQPVYAYLLMIYSIWLVVNLNVREVKMIARQPAAPGGER